MGSPAWRLEFVKQATKQLQRAPPEMRDRITEKLAGLITDPPTGDIVKLRGSREEYRLRVGEWRVIYTPDRSRGVVLITAVHPRGRAYRD